MNPVLWTGTGTTTSFTGMGFSPDLVWIKRRDTTSSNFLVDSVRGASKALYANDTTAEVTRASAVTSFDSDGWSMGSDFNNSGGSYVTWAWRGSDSSPVSNTDGTITSTVSANTDSGFSVVTWTGNGTAGATVGHGLGAVPKWIIVKERGNSNVWCHYHTGLPSPATNTILFDLYAYAGATLWNNSNPTSTTLALSSGTEVNRSGGTYVGYFWAEVEGFSKFGSYTGNGSADGPFIYTGFRPAFVMFKNANDSRHWGIIDTSRSTYNQTNATLEPSTSNGENPYDDFDILSNGFKPRTNDPGGNGNGNTIIYMAFAENPLKQSLAR